MAISSLAITLICIALVLFILFYCYCCFKGFTKKIPPPTYKRKLIEVNSNKKYKDKEELTFMSYNILAKEFAFRAIFH